MIVSNSSEHMKSYTTCKGCVATSTGFIWCLRTLFLMKVALVFLDLSIFQQIDCNENHPSLLWFSSVQGVWIHEEWRGWSIGKQGGNDRRAAAKAFPALPLITIKVLNLGSLNTKNKIEGGKGWIMWLLATRASGSGEIGGGNRSQ